MDVFDQCRKEMDEFIESIEWDAETYYSAITGRLFVPNRHTSPEDVETYISTSLGFYTEIDKDPEYDVSHIIETLTLILQLNNHFK